MGCHTPGFYGKVLLAEILMTFLFVATVVAIIKWDSARDGVTNCLVSGIITYAGIMIASGISGGALNPAFALIQPIF